MPRGTKRPRDTAQLAKLIVDIATGEVEDHEPSLVTKREAGRLGGKKRAVVISSKRRSEIAANAAKKILKR
jgi:hypothetical protein